MSLLDVFLNNLLSLKLKINSVVAAAHHSPRTHSCDQAAAQSMQNLQKKEGQMGKGTEKTLLLLLKVVTVLPLEEPQPLTCLHDRDMVLLLMGERHLPWRKEQMWVSHSTFLFPIVKM